jgi:hypothetical protein
VRALNITGINSEEATINEKGGRHGKLEYRFDLIDPGAVFKLAGVLYEGSIKYEDENWRMVSAREHLNHALCHIYAYLAGDRQEEHLSHAFCRLMMAVALEEVNDS